MTALVIAETGVCAGHPCDHCVMCVGSSPKRVRQSSPGRDPRCCRRDNPGYQLPAEGEWDGPVFGEVGTLSREYDRVECHACGEHFRRLGQHVWQKHDLTAREYKAVFGLKLTESLDCTNNRERNRRGHTFLNDPTDARAIRAATARAQHMLTPERATYLQARQRVSSQERRERVQSGRSGLIRGLRKPVPVCRICGVTTSRRASGGARKTCSPVCAKALWRASMTEKEG